MTLGRSSLKMAALVIARHTKKPGRIGCCKGFCLLQTTDMSAIAMLQLKQQLSQITERERQEISAYLHRLKQQTPAWQKEMTRRMAEMDAGKKFRLPRKPAAAR